VIENQGSCHYKLLVIEKVELRAFEKKSVNLFKDFGNGGG
jgi:hypothetical protein